MLTSSFNRNTLKLLVAAGLVLSGALMATAQAQDNTGAGTFTCGPDTCPTVSIDGHDVEFALAPLSIGELASDFAVFGMPGFKQGDNNSWLNGDVLGGTLMAPAQAQDDVVGVGSHDASGDLPASAWPSCACACDCAGHQIQTVAVVGFQGVNHPLSDENGSEIPPISEWNSDFAVFGMPDFKQGDNNSWLNGDGSVYSEETSGRTTDGSLNASDGPMSAQTLAAHPTCVIYANGHRALVQGALLKASPNGLAATAVVQLDNRQGHGEHYLVHAGSGGFFALDVSVPTNVSAAFVTDGPRLLGMGVCTRPHVAPAPGLGIGGVAVSNSTPADQAAANVQRSVDAFTLF